MFTYRALLASPGYVFSMPVEVDAASTEEAVAIIAAAPGYGQFRERIVTIRPYTKEEKDQWPNVS